MCDSCHKIRKQVFLVTITYGIVRATSPQTFPPLFRGYSIKCYERSDDGRMQLIAKNIYTSESPHIINQLYDRLLAKIDKNLFTLNRFSSAGIDNAPNFSVDVCSNICAITPINESILNLFAKG